MEVIQTLKLCPVCGLKLTAALPPSLCPRCALREEDTEGSHGRESSESLPRAFGNYELLAVVGRGGMGVVYRARQITLNRTVAIKLLLHGAHSSPELLRRFRAEAHAGGKLQHPNVVAIHDVGTHEGHSFLAMDFIEGKQLDELVRDVPLTPRRAARYTHSIARAIQHAHDRGVLHRDLKPSNILINSDDEVQVTDFGLAGSLDDSGDLTVTGQVLGSPNYMSPEQARGLRESIGPSSDVYSIGAILYHLLVGTPPFAARSVAETLRAVIAEDPVPLRQQNASIPLDLETICLKCLAKEPRERYSSAAELADELSRFLRAEPIHARRPGIIERGTRWAARNRSAAGLIAVLACGSVLLAAGLYSANHQRKSQAAAIRIIAERLARSINELSTDRKREMEIVNSEELAALAGRYKISTGNEIRLRLLIQPDHPLDLQDLYQPFLEHLEASVFNDRKRPVRIDLALSELDSLQRLKAAGSGNVFTRIGSAKYLEAVREGLPIAALVQEKSRKDAAIFVHRRSGITNLSQLKGRSFAFADTNATLSIWAKAYLVRAGLTSADLSKWAHLLPPGNSSPERIGKNRDHSHKPALDAVVAGEFDAGVARIKYILEWPELVPILQFDSSPNLWVASTLLPVEVRQALRDAFLDATDPEVLKSAPTKIEGFRSVDARMLSELEAAITSEVRRFEGTSP